FSSRRRHTISKRDWSSDVCSSDLSLAECTLFLRQNGAFPLEAPGRIAAYGNGVRHTVKGGTGSGEVNSRYSVNVEQGLKDAGFKIGRASRRERVEGTD